MSITALRHAVSREIDRAATEHNEVAQLEELEWHVETALTRVRNAIRDAREARGRTFPGPREEYVDQFSV